MRSASCGVTKGEAWGRFSPQLSTPVGRPEVRTVGGWSEVSRLRLRRARTLRISSFPVQIVSCFQPALYLVVDVGQAGDRDAVGDAVAFRKAAGVEEPAGRLRVLEGEAEVDARARGRL